MNFLDIHSHILPAVDDGARDMKIALELLEMMKKQGVTHVVATPHFYPDTDNAEDFAQRIDAAYKDLKQEILFKDLPYIYKGCELHYFSGIGKSKAIEQFAISGTRYVLLELPYGEAITNKILQDITDMREILGLKPILAHIERYFKMPGYKKLLKLISDGVALAQINAAAVTSKEYGKICQKLIKSKYVSFLATDAHSVVNRPPLTGDALEYIGKKMGRSVANRMIFASQKLLDEIEGCNEQ